jgi:hypothetical protein
VHGCLRLKPEELVPIAPRVRAKSKGGVTRATVALSVDVLERLDRYHKQVTVGWRRRGAAPTKSQIVEEALRSYLDRKERRR